MAQGIPARVVLTGTAAPEGGNFASLLSQASANESGQIAFGSTLTGGTSSGGLFRSNSSSTQVLGLSGSSSPSGGNFSNLFSPLINSSGQSAFTATLTGNSSDGVFIGVPGSVQAVALEGSAAPSGGKYSFFGNPSLNNSGQVAFFASLSGGTSAQGVFIGVPAGVQTVALAGNAAPSGGKYSTFSGTALNSAGQVAFFASLTDGTASQGVFVGAPGHVQAAALRGNAAPSGGNYNGFTVPALNAAGQVAFIASLSGGSSSMGVFAGAPGSIQTAALAGTTSPAGGNYTNFDSPLINRTGKIAFRATLSSSTISEGIFVGTPGAIQTVAVRSMGAPGGGNFLQLSRPAINGTGIVAFTSTLSGAGVTAANDMGLYAGTVGELVKIIRKGDVVDVDPGENTDLRTVSNILFTASSGGEDGYGMSFSSAGFLTYGLQFTDGSAGIFTSSINPIPEPSAAGLIAASLTIAWFRRRRSLHDDAIEIRPGLLRSLCRGHP